LYIEQKKKISSLGIKPTEPDMQSHDDALIDELLHSAGVSTENSAARRWLESALAAARSIGEAAPPPTPAKHNAPLDKVERASDRFRQGKSEWEAGSPPENDAYQSIPAQIGLRLGAAARRGACPGQRSGGEGHGFHP